MLSDSVVGGQPRLRIREGGLLKRKDTQLRPAGCGMAAQVRGAEGGRWGDQSQLRESLKALKSFRSEE